MASCDRLPEPSRQLLLVGQLGIALGCVGARIERPGKGKERSCARCCPRTMPARPAQPGRLLLAARRSAVAADAAAWLRAYIDYGGRLLPLLTSPSQTGVSYLRRPDDLGWARFGQAGTGAGSCGSRPPATPPSAVPRSGSRTISSRWW